MESYSSRVAEQSATTFRAEWLHESYIPSAKGILQERSLLDCPGVLADPAQMLNAILVSCSCPAAVFPSDDSMARTEVGIVSL